MIDTHTSVQELFRWHLDTPEGALRISADSTLDVRLSAVQFLSRRAKIESTLSKLVIALYNKHLDEYETVHDIMAGWLYDLQDVINSLPSCSAYRDILNEFRNGGELKGAADNGEAFVASSSSDPHNLLDKDVLHLAFIVAGRWYALVSIETEGGDYTLPVVVSIEDETRLFENENAVVMPAELSRPRYELHQGEWFVIGQSEDDLPLDKYEISSSISDKGRRKIYWDGKIAFCPLTGKPLKVSSYDMTMKK